MIVLSFESFIKVGETSRVVSQPYNNQQCRNQLVVRYSVHSDKQLKPIGDTSNIRIELLHTTSGYCSHDTEQRSRSGGQLWCCYHQEWLCP